LDTRGKILDGAALEPFLLAPGARVAIGHFDPLLASHARRLASARDGAASLVVLVADPPDPLLDARARAELVAALEAVDRVGLATPALLARVPAGALLRMEDDDLRDRDALRRRVRDKPREEP
jgi:hypothetical protein